MILSRNLTMPDDKPAFELIGGPQGDVAGMLRLRYGAGLHDPMPFVLTVTPQYVARETGKTPPVSFADISKYVQQNADKLKGIASFEKGRGFTTHTLE
jgi:hypothetical protein